jgi:hypothetical protein
MFHSYSMVFPWFFYGFFHGYFIQKNAENRLPTRHLGDSESSGSVWVPEPGLVVIPKE